MGIYDRDYYRETEEFSWRPGNTWSGVNIIIAICVVVYVLDIAFIRLPPDQRLFNVLANHTEDLFNPVRWFSFVTYAFMHAPMDNNTGRIGIMHLLFNMFVLWMFGRSVENHLGRARFLTLYMSSVVLCSLLYSLFWYMLGSPRAGVGASGAVSSVLIYFICQNPRTTLYLYGAFPIPAWALGAGLLVFDLLGSLMGLLGKDRGIAHEGHLIGAALGGLYFYFGVPGATWIKHIHTWWRSRHLRVVRADQDRAEKLAEEADHILEKVSRSGYDHLTPREKKTLEEYSRNLRTKK